LLLLFFPRSEIKAPKVVGIAFDHFRGFLVFVSGKVKVLLHVANWRERDLKKKNTPVRKKKKDLSSSVSVEYF